MLMELAASLRAGFSNRRPFRLGVIGPQYVPSSFFFNPAGSKVTSVAAVRAAQQHGRVRRMAPAGAAAVSAGRGGR